MKDEIVATVKRAERLLAECGWNDRAEWFRARRLSMEAHPEASDDFKNIAREIASVLVGMGSFSDVPMYPREGSAMTRGEARAEQWDLVVELGRLTKIAGV
jgi:hypothetical protein